ncbi:MAG: hypothetical protein AB9895_01965 [Negativicutes bacterium]
MVEFKKVSTLLGEQYPDLDVCIGNGTVINVFQWQCLGELTINSNRGVQCEDEEFIKKARSFMQIARDLHAGLVLTPEYSFPYLVLEEIISDKKKWPEQGKLWCLGTQGESRVSFLNNMTRWSMGCDVMVIDTAFNSLDVENFVCPLIYLFLNRENKLCILPQFKTHAMADPRLFFEGPHLCRGNTIFIFEARRAECQNVFFSLICADAIRISATEILHEIDKNSIILYNPQLNPCPRYDRMTLLRDDLINAKFREVRIITLNWAEHTTIPAMNYEFLTPWSAFYKRKGDKDLNNSNFRANKEQNHLKGTAYALLKNHIEIWFSPRHEHCKSILIRKGDHETTDLALTSGDEPKTEQCYVLSGSSWVPETQACCSNVVQLFSIHDADFDFPYPVCQTPPDSCDKCRKSDAFFGSLLGHFEDGEIITDSEMVDRLLVGSNSESDCKRTEKIVLVRELKRLLDAGVIPDALDYFINNNELYVHQDFPNQGSQIVNLKPIRPPQDPYPEALVVISKKRREEEIKAVLAELLDKLSVNYRGQIVIYYKPVISADYIYYDKHLTNPAIMETGFADNLTSIRNPRINPKSWGGELT